MQGQGHSPNSLARYHDDNLARRACLSSFASGFPPRSDASALSVVPHQHPVPSTRAARTLTQSGQRLHVLHQRCGALHPQARAQISGVTGGERPATHLNPDDDRRGAVRTRPLWTVRGMARTEAAAVTGRRDGQPISLSTAQHSLGREPAGASALALYSIVRGAA